MLDTQILILVLLFKISIFFFKSCIFTLKKGVFFGHFEVCFLQFFVRQKIAPFPLFIRLSGTFIIPYFADNFK